MTPRDLLVLGDWGTSRLRLVLFDGDQRLDDVQGPGIGALTTSPLETLAEALVPWRKRFALDRVVMCGMAGSRNGVVEAPYAPCPADALDWARLAAGTAVEGIEVVVAPGVAGERPNGAPDVMRGEEAQIFGAMALDRALAIGEHRLILPGTHSKWCLVRDGRIVRFQTFLTGELFALLQARSTLLLGATYADGSDSEEGFAAGLARAHDAPLLGALFETRSAQLRANRGGDWATAFLSGLIIGAEIAEAVAAFDPESVTLIGADELTLRYLPALQARSLPATVMSGEDCALAGLRLFDATRP